MDNDGKQEIWGLKDLPSPPPGKTGWPWTVACPVLPHKMSDGRRWPLISIVTPSYNQGKYIEETIRSVLLQDYPNLEYIVMDGGSTDGTVEILRKYEPFLSYIYIGRDEGQAAAIKAGFDRATGEILAWLNSDDRYLPGAFQTVATYFAQDRRIAFANSDVNLIDENSSVIKRMFVSRPSRVVTANLGTHSWPQQGCFWRKWAYEKAGGLDPSFEFTMDRDLFLRITAIGRAGRIPGPPLGEFRIHGEAKSSTITEVANAEGLRCIQKYRSPLLCRMPNILKLYWWFFRKPTGIRIRLSRYFGIEY